MWLDSITQTLSNPDCGLSKPHIPDNSPYISHRLIRSNRQGPHPQIYHIADLFFSHTVATICLPHIHSPIATLTLPVTLCVSHPSLLFHLPLPLLLVHSSPFLLLSLSSLPPLFTTFTQRSSEESCATSLCVHMHKILPKQWPKTFH